uniref:Uncharacterized protein n=1 Tax=uncultured marine virus TaxID=186617 RepID=A0A0F7L3H4_9VIRU|nr:hypothetical protein [uncultured marine virus]
MPGQSIQLGRIKTFAIPEINAQKIDVVKTTFSQEEIESIWNQVRGLLREITSGSHTITDYHVARIIKITRVFERIKTKP